MNKWSGKIIKKYAAYFWEYLRFGDLYSIFWGIAYIFTDSVPLKNKIVKSRLGLFKCRAGTIDFQYINYIHEIEVKKFIELNIDQCTHFLDIGACMGEYSVWLAKSGIKCVAFEPIQYNYINILDNIKLNNVDKLVEVKNFGLGNENSIEFFKTDTKRPGTSFMINENLTESEEKAQIIPFDDVFSSLLLGYDDHIIMKLDVEGMEIDVLTGASNFISNTNNLIIILEYPYVGKERITDKLDSLASFSYQNLDDANMVAIKIKN